MTRFLLLLAALLMAAPLLEARAQNTPPVANADAATVEAGVLLRLNVVANDTDVDDDTLTIISLPTTPTKGEAAIVDTADAGQRILYRSTANASGTDTFTYRISDGNGGEADGTVTITIIQNDPPVAADDALTLFANEIAEIDVLDNDSDPNGDSLTIAALPLLPLHGTAEIIGEGEAQRIRYDPDDDFEGTDSLHYEVADPRGSTDVASVIIQVVLNQRPVAADDSLTTFINATAEIDVLANDTDAEDDSLFILSIPDPPANGTAALIDGGQRIRYTPRPGFLGSDAFDYIVSDSVSRGGSLAGDRATVAIQVLPANQTFEAVLSGASVVPPVQTRASGLITAMLDGTTLTFSGAFTGLNTPILAENGGLLQLGITGRSDDVLFPLTITPSPNRRNGTLDRTQNTFALTTEQIEALFARRLYVSILTEAQEGEELRGQLLPQGASAQFQAVFSGRGVIPSTLSQALGGVTAERFGTTLVLTGAFAGLGTDAVGTAGGVRLHQGVIGANGNVLFDLDAVLDANRRGGTLPAQTNQFILTNQQVQLLDNGLTYLVVRSDGEPDGAIRGQLLPLSTRVFEVALAAANEVPALDAPGTGGVVATLDGPTLALSGTFRGLASPVDLSLRNGAHLHQAAPDANGPILFELAALLTPDRQNGSFDVGANIFTLTPEHLAALFDGALYANIHTEDQPGGALRGTLLPSPNVPPAAATVTTPTDGATADLSGAPTTPFSATWSTAGDANGNTVYYRWQLALDAGFQRVVYTADPTPETTLATTTGTLDAALANAGVAANATVMLYHRVVTTDGGMATGGSGSVLTAVRGVATATEAEAVPERFAVWGNYPNPFNPTTTVRLDLPQAARVHVAVYDVLGRHVLTTAPRDLEPGAGHTVSVDARALASGLYLYRVVAEGVTETFTGTGRMTVLK